MAYKDGVTISELLAEKIGKGEQKAAAAELGVTQATVSRWMSGRGAPEAWRSKTLAGFLNLTEDKVIRAMHAQQTDRPLPQRVSSLEEAVASIRSDVARLLERLEPPKQGKR